MIAVPYTLAGREIPELPVRDGQVELVIDGVRLSLSGPWPPWSFAPELSP